MGNGNKIHTLQTYLSRYVVYYIEIQMYHIKNKYYNYKNARNS